MFTLFQKKANVSQNLVFANTVYKNKEHGYGVFVCGVSRPKSKSFVNNVMNSSLKTTCTLEDVICDPIVSYMQGLDPNNYCHTRQDCNRVIIMYKSTNVQNSVTSYITLTEFLDEYELVIGYDQDGYMITESMLDTMVIK